MWNNIETIKTFIPLVTPFVIVLLTFYLKHIYDKKERRYALRIEFGLDAMIIGVQNGFYLLEFITTINNKSLVQKEFSAITLRIRGIKNDEAIGLWTATVIDDETKEPKKVKTRRINFPEKILKETIIPPKWNYIFVEPGVKQEIIYTTPIPEDIRYILATVEFHYDAKTLHTAEKMLTLQAPQSNTMKTKN